jgi:hypothetical protein
MDSIDRLISTTNMKANLNEFANIDPKVSENLIQDIKMLLMALTPEVWQKSPWVTLAESNGYNRRQITLEWLQEWCFMRSMGLNKQQSRRVMNDRHHGLSRSFTTDLHRANHGTGYWDQGWQVVEVLADGYLQVTRDRLFVEIERSRHLPASPRQYKVGDEVSIKMPQNLVVDDYYVAIGNAGLPQGKCVDLFFHMTEAGAVPLLQQLSATFNAASKPFRLAFSYLQEAYPRRDVGIWQIAIADYELARSTLQMIYPELQPYFQTEVPLFSLPIAPGIGLLEPAPTERPMLRYKCLAEALLTVYLTRPASAGQQLEQVVNYLLDNLSVMGFDRDYWHCGVGDRRDYGKLGR